MTITEHHALCTIPKCHGGTCAALIEADEREEEIGVLVELVRWGETVAFPSDRGIAALGAARALLARLRAEAASAALATRPAGANEDAARGGA